MKKNDQYWVITILFLILFLWLNSYQNRFERYNNPFDSLRTEQDYIIVADECNKDCKEFLMGIFVEDEPNYNEAMIFNCSQRCESEYGSMSNGKWIWSQKYYDEFDTSGLSQGNIME